MTNHTTTRSFCNSAVEMHEPRKLNTQLYQGSLMHGILLRDLENTVQELTECAKGSDKKIKKQHGEREHPKHYYLLITMHKYKSAN